MTQRSHVNTQPADSAAAAVALDQAMRAEAWATLDEIADLADPNDPQQLTVLLHAAGQGGALVQKITGRLMRGGAR